MADRGLSLVTVLKNLDKTGYTATASTVNDKTGYSLTAGSYVIRASSTQQGTVTLTGVASASASISSVTVARATDTYSGNIAASGTNPEGDMRIAISGTTTVTGVKDSATNNATAGFTVTELF